MAVVAFLRMVVCVLAAVAVFCGTAGRAAPTVTYDQRQHGEFNLQVDMDDVAIVLLPGDEFAQRSAMFGGGGGKLVHQVFGRRAGNSKKKHKKPVTNCTATATATATATSKPEVPPPSYGTESPPSSAATATTEEYEEVASSGQEKFQEPSYVLHPVDHVHQTGNAVRNPITDDVPHTYPAVTPGDLATNPAAAANAEQMVAVKIVEKPTATGAIPAAGEAVTSGGFTEMVAVKIVEVSTKPTYLSVDVTVDPKTDGGIVEKTSQPAAVPAETEQSKVVVDPVNPKAETASVVKIAEESIGAGPKEKVTEDQPVVANLSDDAASTQAIAKKTVEPVEMVAMKTVEKPAAAEQPGKTAADVPANAQAETPKKQADDDEPVEMVAMKTVEKPAAAEQPGKSAMDVVPANAQAENPKKQADDDDEPVEMVAMKTVEKPAAAAAAVSSVPAAAEPAKLSADSAANAKNEADKQNAKGPKPGGPVEMVAMKTVEKLTFAEALKATPVDSDGAEAAKNRVVAEASVATAPVDLNKKSAPQEMVAMKTMERPPLPSTVAVGSVEKSSGVTTSTKPLEVQEERKKTPGQPLPVETVVSRSAPKVTEMVAVKTMENPTGTTTSVRSVVSVKTMMKPGIPKTALSSNGSTIMRKVGDRKPSPSITLGVAPPKVV